MFQLPSHIQPGYGAATARDNDYDDSSYTESSMDTFYDETDDDQSHTGGSTMLKLPGHLQKKQEKKSGNPQRCRETSLRASLTRQNSLDSLTSSQHSRASSREVDSFTYSYCPDRRSQMVRSLSMESIDLVSQHSRHRSGGPLNSPRKYYGEIKKPNPNGGGNHLARLFNLSTQFDDEDELDEEPLAERNEDYEDNSEQEWRDELFQMVGPKSPSGKQQEASKRQSSSSKGGGEDNFDLQEWLGLSMQFFGHHSKLQQQKQQQQNNHQSLSTSFNLG